MNTADRSIALVDHALRRRFTFLPLRPEYEVLRRYQADRSRNASSLIGLLQRVNQLIGDPHYEIGISYFMVENLPAEMESIWRYEIEPYLEEFFADEPTKVEDIRWPKISSQLGWAV
jgi:5-methylcytosine-specific restriction protein B